MTTGEKIAQLVKVEGSNLRQISIKAGIPYNTLYAIVQRKSNKIDPEILKKIASALEVSWYELYSDSPEEQAQIIRRNILNGLNSSPQSASPEYSAGYKVGYAIGHDDCLKEIMSAPTNPDELRSITHSLLSLGYSLEEVKLMGARLSLPNEDLEAFIQILERNRNKGG